LIGLVLNFRPEEKERVDLVAQAILELIMLKNFIAIIVLPFGSGINGVNTIPFAFEILTAGMAKWHPTTISNPKFKPDRALATKNHLLIKDRAFAEEWSESITKNQILVKCMTELKEVDLART
jgi:hypothetical protein